MQCSKGTVVVKYLDSLIIYNWYTKKVEELDHNRSIWFPVTGGNLCV